MKILAISAYPMEIKPWLAKCTEAKDLQWRGKFARTARWHEHEVFAIANGAGPLLAAKAIEIATNHAGPFDAVMSLGLCGALDPHLPLNAVCTASLVSDGEANWPALPFPGASTQLLLSIDKFLGHPEEKAKYAAQGFGIVEMEAAAIAKYAAANNIPFRAAKVVSDRAEENFALDFNKYRDEDGRFQEKRIALAAIANPFRYAPDLIRMASRGGRASETLGEFLAQSSF